MLVECLLLLAAECASANDFALTVYGGRVTEDRWLESLSLNTELTNAYVLVCAGSRTVKRYLDSAFTLEIEGQVAKYFGGQGHMEFNAPLALRWRSLPWDGAIDTSVSFGIGPSWASEDPQIELKTNESTRQFLVYWFLEIAAGPPGACWSGILRLHHRSTGFGMVAKDGGSNTLAAGLKFWF